MTKQKQESSTVIQTRKIEDGFVKKNITISEGGKVSEFNETLRLYSLAEFKKAFKGCGLKILNLFGDYFGNKFNETKSQRLIIIARKT